MGPRLQERDLEILRFVFKHRVATFDQLMRRFFIGRSLAAVSRRLRSLGKAGYLKQESIFRKGSSTMFYAPTEKAFDAIKTTWNYEMDKPHFKSESIDHDIRMAELGLRLSKLRQFRDLLTENILQSSSAMAEADLYSDLVRLQSDAGLRMVKDNISCLFALELEVSAKSYQRYVEKLQSYYTAQNLTGLIYVCSDQFIINCLVKADVEVRGEGKSILYFGLENESLSTQGSITFRNAKSGRVEFQ